jgi:hypothetical protein
LTTRIDETAATVQKVIVTPLRQGAALVAGIKAAMDVFRDFTKRSSGVPHAEDEDGLFIG